MGGKKRSGAREEGKSGSKEGKIPETCLPGIGFTPKPSLPLWGTPIDDNKERVVNNDVLSINNVKWTRPSEVSDMLKSLLEEKHSKLSEETAGATKSKEGNHDDATDEEDTASDSKIDEAKGQSRSFAIDQIWSLADKEELVHEVFGEMNGGNVELSLLNALPSICAQVAHYGVFAWKLISPLEYVEDSGKTKTEKQTLSEATDKTKASTVGQYAVRIFTKGNWKRIIVDDHIPLRDNGSIALPHIDEKAVLWPILVSKALLVASSDAVVNDASAACAFVVRSLTGWVVETCTVRNDSAIAFCEDVYRLCGDNEERLCSSSQTYFALVCSEGVRGHKRGAISSVRFDQDGDLFITQGFQKRRNYWRQRFRDEYFLSLLASAKDSAPITKTEESKKSSSPGGDVTDTRGECFDEDDKVKRNSKTNMLQENTNKRVSKLAIQAMMGNTEVVACAVKAGLFDAMITPEKIRSLAEVPAEVEDGVKAANESDAVTISWSDFVEIFHVELSPLVLRRPRATKSAIEKNEDSVESATVSNSSSSSNDAEVSAHHFFESTLIRCHSLCAEGASTSKDNAGVDDSTATITTATSHRFDWHWTFDKMTEGESELKAVNASEAQTKHLLLYLRGDRGKSSRVLLTLESDGIASFDTSSTHASASISLVRADEMRREIASLRGLSKRSFKASKEDATEADLAANGEVESKEAKDDTSTVESKDDETEETLHIEILGSDNPDTTTEGDSVSPLPNFGHRVRKQRRSIYEEESSVFEPERDSNTISSWEGIVNIDSDEYDVTVTEMPCNKTNQVRLRCELRGEVHEGTMTVSSNQKNHTYVHKQHSCYYEELAVKYCSDLHVRGTKRSAPPPTFRSSVCRAGDVTQLALTLKSGSHLYHVFADCSAGGALEIACNSKAIVGDVPTVLSKAYGLDLYSRRGSFPGFDGSDTDASGTQWSLLSSTKINVRGEGSYFCAQFHVNDVIVRRHVRFVLVNCADGSARSSPSLRTELTYLPPINAGYLLLAYVRYGRSTSSAKSMNVAPGLHGSEWELKIASSSSDASDAFSSISTSVMHRENGSYRANRYYLCFRKQIDLSLAKNVGFRFAVSDPDAFVKLQVVAFSRRSVEEQQMGLFPVEKVLAERDGRKNVFLPAIPGVAKHLRRAEGDESYVLVVQGLLDEKRWDMPASLRSKQRQFKTPASGSKTRTDQKAALSWDVIAYGSPSEAASDPKETPQLLREDTSYDDTYDAVVRSWSDRWENEDKKTHEELLSRSRKRAELFRSGTSREEDGDTMQAAEEPRRICASRRKSSNTLSIKSGDAAPSGAIDRTDERVSEAQKEMSSALDTLRKFADEQARSRESLPSREDERNQTTAYLRGVPISPRRPSGSRGGQ
eukprot:g836.t1